MGTIANTIGQSLGNKGTGLQNFLAKFYSTSNNYVDQLDPFSTFDVSFKFYPCGDETSTDDNWKAVLAKAAKSAVSNAVNNLTGGLAQAISEFGDDNTVKKLKNSSKAGKHTFIEYLAHADRLVGSDSWLFDTDKGQLTSPLELELGPYVQDMQIPQLMMADGGKVNTQFGEFPMNGNVVKPDSNELMMTILNTKASLHERIFYPWMREITLPYWCYDKQPYTTATITVDFTKHNACKYVFYGCRPMKIQTLTANQDTSSGENLKRQVTFFFDFMSVKYDVDKVKDDLVDIGLDALKKVMSPVANIANL